MSLRKAEKAGSWYAASPRRLAADLDEYLSTFDPESVDGTAKAGVVPHAGLAFSGPTAGKTWAALRACDPEIVVVFGAVHTMLVDTCAVWAEGAWETPLGEVAVDEDFAAALTGTEHFVADERPHGGDNAIELQMPFIRHCFPDATVVPVAAPPLDKAVEAGAALKRVVDASGKRVAVAGSTDLTHYGASFALMPAGTGASALQWAKQNDRTLLDHVLDLDAESVVPTATRDSSACGAGALAATTAFAREDGLRPILVEHLTSHDVMPRGEAEHFVGYASLVFVN